MHQTLLSYKSGRYFWWSAALTFACLIMYIIHNPANGANGGTWLGYLLGVIATGMMLWLAWFGVRKRSYHSTTGTVAGWLSAHVYFGLALLVIATLHTGFQFGWNIHTLAYVLLVLVTCSGLYGVYCYMHFPSLITENRGEAASDSLIKQIQDIDRQALAIASEISPETHNQVLKDIRRSRVGGSVFNILFGDETQLGMETLIQQARIEKQKLDDKSLDSTMAFMANRIADGREGVNELLEQLSDLLLGQKEQLIKQLERDIKLKAYMEVWLYIHVPASFALLAALFVHIITVFVYN